MIYITQVEFIGYNKKEQVFSKEPLMRYNIVKRIRKNYCSTAVLLTSETFEAKSVHKIVYNEDYKDVYTTEKVYQYWLDTGATFKQIVAHFEGKISEKTVGRILADRMKQKEIKKHNTKPNMATNPVKLDKK